MLLDKILEIKKSAFFHDILHSFVSKGFSICLSFFVTILITRNFTVEVFGEYSYLLSIAITFFQFSHLGFSSANTYYVVRNKRLLPFLLGNTFTLSIVMCVISLTVLLILNHFYFHREVLLIIATALIVPVLVQTELSKGLYIGLRKVRVSNYIDLLAKALYSIMVVSVVVYFQSILSLLLAYFFQMAVFSSASFFNLFKKSKNKIKPSFNLFKKTSSYSLRLYFTLFLSFLVLKIDVYFIENMLGNKPLGIYSLAAILASNLILIIQVLIPLLVPRLSELKDDLAKIKKLMGIMGYAFLLLIFINLVFLFCGEWLIVLVFDEKYLSSVPIFRILLMATSILSLESILAQYYASIGKIKFLIKYWILTLISNVILNYFWIPEYGIEGASYASLISYSFILILLLSKILIEFYNWKTKHENKL
tara:strand:+ start:5716 stop:6981 length:1266 start_codon:yes stop_codon:yes gene_type:complete